MSDNPVPDIAAAAVPAGRASPWRIRKAGDSSNTHSSWPYRTSELLCVARLNAAVADMLADHCAVLALHQRIVRCTISSRFGELLHQQFVQQVHHHVVDELRSVVAMEPQDSEGELMQDRFQYGNQMTLRNGLYAAHHFPLRYGIHRIV